MGVAISDIQGDVELVGNELRGTLLRQTGSNGITDVYGEGYFVALHIEPSSEAVSTEVGIEELAELDASGDVLLKVENQYGYKLHIVQTDGEGAEFATYINLDRLTLE